MDLNEWEKLSPEEQQKYWDEKPMTAAELDAREAIKAGLEGCNCLLPGRKYLLITALSVLKAQLCALSREIAEKDSSSDPLLTIISSKISRIDKTVEEVENTPNCLEERRV